MNIKKILLLSALLMSLGSHSLAQATNTTNPTQQLTKSNCSAALNFSFRKLSNAKRVNLCEEYQGKVILIVNTASRCGFTPQFAGLEKLYQNYKARGLVVLGFPSSDFGSQELSKEKDIAEFCQLTYGVKFPMFEKTHASQSEASPFYQTLGELSGEYPQWNFHKYLINKEGKLIASLASHVSPTGKKLTDLIEKSL